MKLGLVIRECHVLQTHLNWSRDFTGSLLRISITTSTGRYSDIVKRERDCDASVERKQNPSESGSLRERERERTGLATENKPERVVVF